MPIFKDKSVFQDLFADLWRRLINETELGPQIRKERISLRFEIEDPDVVMYVNEEGALFGDKARAKTPLITMKITGDDAHWLWLRKLNIPEALTLRRIRAKGPVSKILQMLPLLQNGMEIYPDYCKKFDLPFDC